MIGKNVRHLSLCLLVRHSTFWMRVQNPTRPSRARLCESTASGRRRHSNWGDGGAGDGDVTDGGTSDASCFTNPTTYLEIINACTNATAVYKMSHPPLLNPDGTLPSLPP